MDGVQFNWPGLMGQVLRQRLVKGNTIFKIMQYHEVNAGVKTVKIHFFAQFDLEATT